MDRVSLVEGTESSFVTRFSHDSSVSFVPSWNGFGIVCLKINAVQIAVAKSMNNVSSMCDPHSAAAFSILMFFDTALLLLLLTNDMALLVCYARLVDPLVGQRCRLYPDSQLLAQPDHCRDARYAIEQDGDANCPHEPLVAVN